MKDDSVTTGGAEPSHQNTTKHLLPVYFSFVLVFIHAVGPCFVRILLTHAGSWQLSREQMSFYFSAHEHYRQLSGLLLWHVIGTALSVGCCMLGS